MNIFVRTIQNSLLSTVSSIQQTKDSDCVRFWDDEPVSHKLILMELSGSRPAVMKRVFEVYISTDDVWVLASEFEHDQDEVFTASLRDIPLCSW